MDDLINKAIEAFNNGEIDELDAEDREQNV